MSGKVTAGQRVKPVLFMRFISIPYIHLLLRKNKSNFSPGPIPKINSTGYNRNKRIFPLTSQNYSLTTLFLQFHIGKDRFPPTST